MWDFKKHSDNIAVIEESGSIVTYGELTEHANNLTDMIPERSLVFCLCKNTIGSLLGYTAFLNAKIVPLMLDESVN